jgi:hypothetical protein|tara:strand:+ start:598 stop:846 length:249 start_codon:yes stop_codon:yes gene_type:complete
MVDQIFDRSNLNHEQMIKLIRSIQQKLAFIEKKGGYTEAYHQMKKQLDFLLIEMQGRMDKDVSDQILDEKPFIIGEEESERK